MAEIAQAGSKAKGRAADHAAVPARWVSAAVLSGAMLTVTIYGLPYYLLDSGGRVRSDLHPWLKASGFIGQSSGIAALALFLFIWLYPLRKKFRFLSFTGSLARWLDLHVVAGLVLPWLAAIHAGYRFTGLIGLAYLAMLLVCLSGVVGKYLYTRIPRTASGLAMDRSQIRSSCEGLIRQISETTGIGPDRIRDALSMPADEPEKPRSLAGSLVMLIAGDLLRWRKVHSIRHRWLAAGRNRKPLDRRTVGRALRLARKEIALIQRLRFLETTERLFRFWHVAHRPFAITALVGVLIHVGVVVALGVTWLY